jgi:hypothetical protein
LRLVRTRSGKGSAAALAALCLLGPILGYAHMLLVAHARCPEHGELLHLDAPAVSEPVASSENPTREPAVAPESDLASETHDHDHCVVTSARKTQAAVRSAGPLLVVGDHPPQQLADDGAVTRPPVALYVLAPKNSPPA